MRSVSPTASRTAIASYHGISEEYAAASIPSNRTICAPTPAQISTYSCDVLPLGNVSFTDRYNVPRKTFFGVFFQEFLFWFLIPCNRKWSFVMFALINWYEESNHTCGQLFASMSDAEMQRYFTIFSASYWCCCKPSSPQKHTERFGTLKTITKQNAIWTEA